MNLYKAMKDQHQEEINNFPMFFAFNDKQFEEGMEKLNLTPTDTDKIYKAGSSSYYRKTDSKRLHSMISSHDEELKNAMTDEQFVYDMFDYELGNHEYCITYDITDTLDALGLTVEEVENSELLSTQLKKARYAQSEWYAENG